MLPDRGTARDDVLARSCARHDHVQSRASWGEALEVHSQARLDEIAHVLIGVTSDPPLRGRLDRAASKPGPEWWQDLVEEAIRHRVGYHLLQSVAEGGASPPPQRVGIRLEQHVAEVNGWLDLRLAEIRRVLAHLGAIGLSDCVVLKGPSLCALYPSPYFHPIADLDLLAPSDRADLLLRGLADLGYRPRMMRYPEETWDEAMPAEVRRRLSEPRDLPAFMREEGGVTYSVDVKTPRHHMEFRPLILDDMLQRAEPDEVCGIALRRLCWSDALLWMAAHAWWHHLHRELWIEQLAAMGRLVRTKMTPQRWEQAATTIESYAREQQRLWPATDDVARAYAARQGVPASWPALIWEDVRAQVHLALDLVRRIYGTPVPESMLAATRPAEPRLLDASGDGGGFPTYRFYLWRTDRQRRLFGLQWLPLNDLIGRGLLAEWFSLPHTFAVRLGPERPLSEFA